MSKRRIITALIVAAAALACLAAFLLLSPGRGEAQLEFSVRDGVSRHWVWNVTMTLQDRVMRGYYQSDGGLSLYRFTRLKPGRWDLEISADSYAPLSVPVQLKPGLNRLEAPLDMEGLEIPGLAKFIAFEKAEAGDIVAELRPVGGDGEAVVNHPCLDLWVGCRVSAETKQGQRGELLFEGPVPWAWDASPESLFRYSARIPGGRIKPGDADYLVIDYLIIVPDPRKITGEQVRETMSKVQLGDAGALDALLGAERERMKGYFLTSRHVKAAGG